MCLTIDLVFVLLCNLDSKILVLESLSTNGSHGIGLFQLLGTSSLSFQFTNGLILENLWLALEQIFIGFTLINWECDMNPLQWGRLRCLPWAPCFAVL